MPGAADRIRAATTSIVGFKGPTRPIDAPDHGARRGYPRTGRTVARIAAPTARNTSTVDIPARWLPVAWVTIASTAGPKKPVMRPDSANSPKCAATSPSGRHARHQRA